MNIIQISETASTNSWLAQNEETVPSPSLVYTITQTAGRGQRGNSWESEPGKNITASLIFHPENFLAIDQFAISELIAVSIVEFLGNYGVKAEIKWPNDIYVGNKKICGILVEHTVTGRMVFRTIAGMGININQEVFYSDAPNPVSLTMLTGMKYPLKDMVEKLASIIENNFELLSSRNELHEKFLSLLWRKDGIYHKFIDKNKNESIEARVHDVALTGMLSLVTSKGETREYAFKEVEFVI